VSRDGQRFLVLEWPGEAAASPIVVVLGLSAQKGVEAVTLAAGARLGP